MSPTLRAMTPLHLLGAILFATLAVASTGCENKAIGRPCDIQAPVDGGVSQPTINSQALECPTRICLSPGKEGGKAVDTTPYCTAECSSDGDCDGETRDTSNPRDRRCKGGFVCGVATVVGAYCCKKVCLCKDFINPTTNISNPPECNNEKAANSCRNL